VYGTCAAKRKTDVKDDVNSGRSIQIQHGRLNMYKSRGFTDPSVPFELMLQCFRGFVHGPLHIQMRIKGVTHRAIHEISSDGCKLSRAEWIAAQLCAMAPKIEL
jgi:hypothetical protein